MRRWAAASWSLLGEGERGCVGWIWWSGWLRLGWAGLFLGRGGPVSGFGLVSWVVIWVGRWVVVWVGGWVGGVGVGLGECGKSVGV